MVLLKQDDLVQHIQEAVKEGRACRAAGPGVTCGLYPLEKIAPFTPCRKSYGSLPIVCGATRWYPAHPTRDYAETIKKIYARFPDLEGFDLKGHKMVVAGSVVTAAISGSFFPNDVDVFFVGHASAESIKQAIYALVEHVATTGLQEQLTIFRTPGCISLLKGGYILQLVLRNYATNAEVLHGFDLGSCSALWDGSSVVTTRLGRLALEFGINVFDVTVKRNTYEKRMFRYLQRGFDVYFAHLDVEKILQAPDKENNVFVNLPFVKFMVFADQCIVRMIPLYFTHFDESSPDYFYYATDEFKHNMFVQICKNDPFPPVASRVYTPGMDVCSIQPDFFSHGDDNDFCEEIVLNPLKFFSDELGSALLKDAWRNPRQFGEATEILDMLIASAHKKADFEFCIRTVEDGTTFTPNTQIDDRAWYGEYYAEKDE